MPISNTVYDYILMYIAIYCYIYLYMTIHGYICLYITICGYIWLYIYILIFCKYMKHKFIRTFLLIISFLYNKYKKYRKKRKEKKQGDGGIHVKVPMLFILKSNCSSPTWGAEKYLFWYIFFKSPVSKLILCGTWGNMAKRTFYVYRVPLY